MEVQSAFGVSALGMGDAFRIDDLLDFSNEDIAGPIGDGGLLSNMDSVVTDAETMTNAEVPGSLSGAKMIVEDHVTDALCVPCDDLAELEWLSKFVEDSFTMDQQQTRPLTNNSGGLSVSTDIHSFGSSYNNSKDRFHSTSPVSVLESSGSSGRVANLQPVPGRARSKRARSGGRVWGNSRILASSSSTTTTDTESLSSDSNVMSGGHYSPGPSTLSADSHHPLMFMTPPPKAVTTVKKPWKPGKGGKKGQESAQPWRCMHCQTQRTPQWRAGPMGPKTLCNACGVRYKSGRLVPEYRPAGSPGYIGYKHSNSHKKILEMRRQREQQQHHHQQQAALQHQHHHQQQSCMLTSSHVSPHSLLVQHLEDFEDDPAGICSSSRN